jgi:hypothetical protein
MTIQVGQGIASPLVVTEAFITYCTSVTRNANSLAPLPMKSFTFSTLGVDVEADADSIRAAALPP